MTDADMIEAHIARHGVTRCPAAIVAPTTAVLRPEDAAAHLARGERPPAFGQRAPAAGMDAARRRAGAASARRARLTPAGRMHPGTRKVLDLLTDLARSGGRCPGNADLRAVAGGVKDPMANLVAGGYVRVTVLRAAQDTWRVVEILKGAAAGLRTASPPADGGWRRIDCGGRRTSLQPSGAGA